MCFSSWRRGGCEETGANGQIHNMNSRVYSQNGLIKKPAKTKGTPRSKQPPRCLAAEGSGLLCGPLRLYGTYMLTSAPWTQTWAHGPAPLVTWAVPIAPQQPHPASQVSTTRGPALPVRPKTSRWRTLARDAQGTWQELRIRVRAVV